MCGEEKGSSEALRAQHDVIGATYLRMLGFVEKVAHLIEGHVLAKRYLCFKEKHYYETLSPGSKRTLTFQGGIMSESEASLFEKDTLFEASKLMRRWDEMSKVGYVMYELLAHHSYISFFSHENISLLKTQIDIADTPHESSIMGYVQR